MIVGRQSPEAKGVRGRAFAAGQAYFRAVDQAGGTPVMLPPLPALADEAVDLLRRFDALVLHGGGDIDPRRYGQEPSSAQLYGIVPEHDEVELAVVRAALEIDLPMLAICRGMQMLNVALGGTLVQHIGTDDHWMQLHPVNLVAGSRVAMALGAPAARACHSVHHQVVDRLGDGLDLTAMSDDGLPEAMEVAGARWAVGVQWHPEDTAADDPQQQALFDELLRQVRES